MNERLAELLREYEEGDLIAAADIVDAASALARSTGSSDTRLLAEAIAETMREAVRDPDRAPNTTSREAWISALTAEAPAEESLAATWQLAFLASAVGHLSAIVDLLKRYSDGDLTLATEILAETQQLATDDATPEEALPIITRIRDTFFEHVRRGVAAAEASPTEVEAAAGTPDDVAQAEPHRVAVDDIDVVVSFLRESVDHLDDIEHRVLALEENVSEELVNSIFRSVHTIKGVASFIGFSYVSETSHVLETLLDDVRNSEQDVTEDVVTMLLDGTDVVAHIIHDIEAQVAAEESAPESLVERSYGHRAILHRVTTFRAGGGAPVQKKTTVPVTRPVASSSKSNANNAPVVTREMIENFVEESADLIDHVEQELLTAESRPIEGEAVDRLFRSIHTVKGNAGFFWFTRIEQRCMTMENALETYRSSKAAIDHAAATEFLDAIDAIREGIRAVAQAAGSSDVATLERERGSVDEGSNALGEILIQMGEITEESLQHALKRQQMRLGEILVAEQNVKPESVERALGEQAKRRGAAAPATGDYALTRKDIRVDTVKLDKLFELVGELITAESMVISGVTERSSGTGTNGHHVEGRSGIGKAASYLQKITREMQEITLSIRMIPLEATFGKMRRLVRDLARRFEKDVSIEIFGEETEMDKNVIEEIGDPLVHIIRNAIDHGIESAAEREAAGKDRAGTIRLSAKHEGNEIWITVQDDGRGLNRDKILAKAIERGVLKDGDPVPSDEEIYRFIFRPAFSTADEVSEISGRGVGMDVVRQNVEKLRGRIDLQSEAGAGSTFVLRIPLTLAILDGVTFNIGATQYSIPATDLVTFQRYDSSTITRTSADHHGFRLRDEVIPIIQYENRGEVPEHGVVIVLQSEGERAALVVDSIVGYRQIVVRAVPSYIQGMRAVSGCSIQGDGAISFIIDVAQLIAQELDHVGSR